MRPTHSLYLSDFRGVTPALDRPPSESRRAHCQPRPVFIDRFWHRGVASPPVRAVGFHRLIFPDGRWVSLEFRGLNQIGEGALKDQVTRHYFSMFASVGAVGIISGLTLRGSNPYGGGVDGFRAGAGQGLAQGATTILDRFLNRLPTITIRAGHRLRIWLTSDVLVPRPA